MLHRHPELTRRFALVAAVLAWVARPGAVWPGELEEEFLEQDELELEFELLQADELVITATKQEQTAAEAPAIIEVITREQILQRNYRTVAEAVSSVPGVFVNYDYVFYDMGLRGISAELRGASHLVKVMINGQAVSFRSETTNFLGPELVPIDAVERIEVIRGPVSALYGANAFLGVVNIITRSGQAARGATASVSGSLFQESYGGISLGLAAGGKLGDLELFLAVAHTREERSGLKIRCTAAIEGEGPCDYLTDITARLMERQSFDDIGQPTSVLATAGLEIGPALGRIDLTGSFQLLDYRGSFSDWGSLNYDYQLDAEGNAVAPLAHSGNRVALYNGLLHGRYSLGLLGDRIGIAAGAAYAQGGAADQERLKDLSGPVNRSGYRFEGVDLALEVSLTCLKGDPGGDGDWVNDLTLRLGADYTQDDITYVPQGAAPSRIYTTSSLHNLGVWGQATGILIGGRLRLIAGLRYDSHRGALLGAEALASLSPKERDRLCADQVCYDQLSYRAGATYLLAKNVRSLGSGRGFLLDALFLKALFGTAFKAPSPIFLYSQDFLGERPLNPNPGLLPQQVDSLELHVGASGLEKKLHLALTFFYNNLTNKAEFARYGLAVVANNAATVSSWGLEGQLQLRWMPLELYATLSHQDSHRLLGENLDRRIDDVFGYPDIMIRAGVFGHIPELLLVANLELQYVGERVGHFFNRSDRVSDRYTLAPYCLLHFNLVTRNLKLSGEKETRLALSLRNVLNTRYDFPGFQPFYRYDVPGLPRILMLSLSQDF